MSMEHWTAVSEAAFLAKDSSGFNRFDLCFGRMDRVVPLSMEGVAGDVDFGQFPIGYNDPLWVGVFIEFAADTEAGLGRGGADEIDDHAIADERPSLPVHRDEGEEPVLDLV